MGMFVFGHLWQMSAISWLLDFLGVGGVIPDWHRESMCLGTLPLEIVLKNSLNIINQLKTGGALILNIYSVYLSLVKTQTGHILRSCTSPGVGPYLSLNNFNRKINEKVFPQISLFPLFFDCILKLFWHCGIFCFSCYHPLIVISYTIAIHK